MYASAAATQRQSQERSPQCKFLSEFNGICDHIKFLWEAVSTSNYLFENATLIFGKSTVFSRKSSKDLKNIHKVIMTAKMKEKFIKNTKEEGK